MFTLSKFSKYISSLCTSRHNLGEISGFTYDKPLIIITLSPAKDVKKVDIFRRENTTDGHRVDYFYTIINVKSLNIRDLTFIYTFKKSGYCDRISVLNQSFLQSLRSFHGLQEQHS